MKEDNPFHHPQEDLHTSLHLVVSVLLLALATGAILDHSHWFGGSLIVLLHLAIGYNNYRIAGARKFHVKVVEVSLLSVLFLLLVPLSILSISHYPLATKSIALSIIALSPFLISLLYRKKSTILAYFLFIFSILVIITSAVVTGLSQELEFVVTFPVAAIAILATASLYRIIFVLREELSVRRLKVMAMDVVLYSGAAGLGIYAAGVQFSLVPVLSAACGALLYFLLDFLQHMMRLPFSEWTKTSMKRSLLHVWIKLTALLVIAGWGGLPYVLPGPPEKADNSNGEVMNDKRERNRAEDRALPGTFYTVILFAAHACHAKAKIRYRSTVEPEERETANDQSTGQPSQSLESTGIPIGAWIILVFLAMIWLAWYSCFAPHPLGVSNAVLLMMTASLFLILTHLLDLIRIFLIPYNCNLRRGCICLAIYCVLYFAYIFVTFDRPAAIAAAANYTGVGDKSKKPGDPVTIALVVFPLSILLAFHFAWAIKEEEERNPQTDVPPDQESDEKEDEDAKVDTRREQLL